jgi:hypothetical protein
LWLGLLSALAVVSAFDVHRSENNGYTVDFRVTWITGLLVALIWLPSLLHVIAIAGGNVKTPAGEATTGGLLAILGNLDASGRRQVLPSVLAALDDVEVRAPAPAQSEVRALRSVLEEELASASSTDTRSELDDLAEHYERLRKELPSGDERTFFMTRVVAQARAAATRLPLPEQTARELFESEREGARIVALGIVQARPSTTLFDLVENAISSSRSAFEQFHGLRALDEMVAALSPMQRRRARTAIESQLRSDRIAPADPGRWDYSRHLLDQL